MDYLEAVVNQALTVMRVGFEVGWMVWVESLVEVVGRVVETEADLEKG